MFGAGLLRVPGDKLQDYDTAAVNRQWHAPRRGAPRPPFCGTVGHQTRLDQAAFSSNGSARPGNNVCGPRGRRTNSRVLINRFGAACRLGTGRLAGRAILPQPVFVNCGADPGCSPELIRRTPARRRAESGPSPARHFARDRINSRSASRPRTSNRAIPRWLRRFRQRFSRVSAAWYSFRPGRLPDRLGFGAAHRVIGYVKML
jgi:hypothetical protein